RRPRAARRAAPALPGGRTWDGGARARGGLQGRSARGGGDVVDGPVALRTTDQVAEERRVLPVAALMRRVAREAEQLGQPAVHERESSFSRAPRAAPRAGRGPTSRRGRTPPPTRASGPRARESARTHRASRSAGRGAAPPRSPRSDPPR